MTMSDLLPVRSPHTEIPERGKVPLPPRKVLWSWSAKRWALCCSLHSLQTWHLLLPHTNEQTLTPPTQLSKPETCFTQPITKFYQIHFSQPSDPIHFFLVSLPRFIPKFKSTSSLTWTPQPLLSYPPLPSTVQPPNPQQSKTFYKGSQVLSLGQGTLPFLKTLWRLTTALIKIKQNKILIRAFDSNLQTFLFI